MSRNAQVAQLTILCTKGFHHQWPFCKGWAAESVAISGLGVDISWGEGGRSAVAQTREIGEANGLGQDCYTEFEYLFVRTRVIGECIRGERGSGEVICGTKKNYLVA